MVLGWLGTAAAAVPFPEQDQWRWLLADGGPVEDPAGDHEGEHASQDLVGDASAPALAWYADDATVFFQLRLAADPTEVDATWGLLLDADGDPANFEYLVQVSGLSHRLDVLANETSAAGTFVEAVSTVDPLGFGALASGEVQARPSDAQAPDGPWLLELQLPRSAVEGALGIGPATPFGLVGVTSRYWPLGLTDVGSCDPSTQDCAVMQWRLSEPVAIDADLDGATGPLEEEVGTDPADADSDDDGLFDAEELIDRLEDGILDALQCDADGDGLSDGTERGRTQGTSGTRASARCFVADADPGRNTDPDDPDTDDGGLLDGREDANRNGALDVWETDPLDPSDDADADGDAIPDLFDELFGLGPDVDSDGDGLDDEVEGLGDTDGDDLPDFADTDSDGDGFLDGEEGAGDADGDKLRDFQDPDSDNDGLLDRDEGLADSDGDGRRDAADEDSDDDGLLDRDEGLVDTDGDGLRDAIDPDSDDDGLSDEDEGEEDTDGDGLRNSIDPDSDNDGVPDAVEGDEDADRDGKPNYLDTDSDNDRVPDSAEGEGDADCDGRIDRLDSDPEDGFCDELTPPPAGDGIPPERRLSPAPAKECGCQTATPRPWLLWLLVPWLTRRAQGAHRARPR